MDNQNSIRQLQELQELYYTQVYSEGAFGSSSMPAASSDAAKEAANKHRRAAETATSPSVAQRHRDAAARYEVTARRMSMTADHYEFLVGYLINENFASDLNSAVQIIENMSEDWIQSIFEENLNEVTGMGRVLFRGFQSALKRGMRVDPETKAYTKAADLEDRLELLKRQIHHSNRGVKKSLPPQDNPQVRKLEDRIDKINTIRHTTK